MTFEDASEAFAKRWSWPAYEARSRADAQIRVAVDRALGGDLTAFDQLCELETFARQMFDECLRAGEGAEGVEFVLGTTGGRLR